jgi:hypothetical protein
MRACLRIGQSITVQYPHTLAGHSSLGMNLPEAAKAKQPIIRTFWL